MVCAYWLRVEELQGPSMPEACKKMQNWPKSEERLRAEELQVPSMSEACKKMQN